MSVKNATILCKKKKKKKKISSTPPPTPCPPPGEINGAFRNYCIIPSHRFVADLTCTKYKLQSRSGKSSSLSPSLSFTALRVSYFYSIACYTVLAQSRDYVYSVTGHGTAQSQVTFTVLQIKAALTVLRLCYFYGVTNVTCQFRRATSYGQIHRSISYSYFYGFIRYN